MRVRLKGINSVSKRLADGTTRTYWYAWKGGPPLRGEPGTPEFIHSYNEAAARKATGPQGTMLSLLQGYQQSTNSSISARARAATTSNRSRRSKTGLATSRSRLFQIGARAASSSNGGISSRSNRGGRPTTLGKCSR